MKSINHEIVRLDKSRIPYVVATIIKTKGSIPREIGAKMLVYKDHEGNKSVGTVGGGKLEHDVIDEALSLLPKGKSKVVECVLDASAGQVCGGSAEVFLEVSEKRPDLYIFGAGHVGQALSKTMDQTVFNITLIDEREEWTNAPEVPESVDRKAMSWENFVKDAMWSNDVYVVVMSHDHKYDRAILESVLTKECSFVGLMGSRAKWKEFQGKLIEAGLTEEQIARVKTPIGDKSLGRGPAEIAVGIAHDLLKFFYAKV